MILRYIREAPLCQLSALAIEAGHNDSLSRDARNGRTCGTSPCHKGKGPRVGAELASSNDRPGRSVGVGVLDKLF